MIISQTPLRVSFVGGSTDLPSFYRSNPGAVLNTTIDKYIYVIVKQRYDTRIVLNYTSREVVNQVDEINHALIREALRMTGIDRGIEITTIADIPSSGSGLGSSSSLTVGLLNAFYSYRGLQKSALEIADKACQIEINVLNNPIGKQDQYAAAVGGLKIYNFYSDERVDFEDVDINPHDLLSLNTNLYLVYTNMTRSANEILQKQIDKKEQNLNNLLQLADMPARLKRILETGNIDKVGALLDKGWKVKKQLENSITNNMIESLYAEGCSLGATGAKILGAGGGGFMLFYVPLEERARFIQGIKNKYRLLPFKFERAGTRIILNMGTNDNML